MAAKSNNKYDIYQWILEVVKSCKTLDQANTARRLIRNFDNQFGDGVLVSILESKEHDKYFELTLKRYHNNGV